MMEFITNMDPLDIEFIACVLLVIIVAAVIIIVKAVHRRKLKRDYGITAQKLTKEEIAAANEGRLKINISPVNPVSAMQDAIQGEKYELGGKESKENQE